MSAWPDWGPIDYKSIAKVISKGLLYKNKNKRLI